MYKKSITREHRTAFVVLIDQSGSMVEDVDFEGETLTKANAVAMATNQILSELIERAHRIEGVRDYYDVAVVGYSGDGVQSMVAPNDTPFVSITKLAERDVESMDYPSRRRNATGGEISVVTSVPSWVRPIHRGETPMFEAFNYVYTHMKRWCSMPENYDSFPPIIFNITDGESSDCTTEEFINISRKLRSLTTSDGNVFVINIHLASSQTHASMIFPTTTEVEECDNLKARDLSAASSIMPEPYNKLICEVRGIKADTEFVGVSYNSSIAELITILNIGTISVKQE